MHPLDYTFVSFSLSREVAFSLSREVAFSTLLPLGSIYETQHEIEDINCISRLSHLFISVCFLELMCHYINLVIS